MFDYFDANDFEIQFSPQQLVSQAQESPNKIQSQPEND